MLEYQLWLEEAIAWRKFDLRRRLFAAIDSCKFPLHPDEIKVIVQHIAEEKPKPFEKYSKEITDGMREYFYARDYELIIEQQRNIAINYLIQKESL